MATKTVSPFWASAQHPGHALVRLIQSLDIRKLIFQRTVQAILNTLGTNIIGLEYKHHAADEWGVILEEMSNPEYPFRIQFFSSTTLRGHVCFHTLADAVHGLVQRGFRKPDAGVLDSLAKTTAWIDNIKSLSSYPEKATLAK